MEIVITGSLGNISKPLMQELVQKGHSVTVISSKPDKQKDIEAAGAKAAIGSLEDVAFLTATFKGADVVYCMEPPVSFMTQTFESLRQYINQLVHNYVQAIQQAGVKQVVKLSSIGAHTDKGNGMLAYHYYAEQILNQLPHDVSITFMRPVGFYYNLLNFVNGIKNQDVITSNYGGGDIIPWVAPADIATAIAEEIETAYKGRKIRYVASEEISCNDIASVLGAAIGKPDLKWLLIADEQVSKGMQAFGMNKELVESFVEMNAAQHSGVLFEDYYRNRPVLGKVKMTDFAKDFAQVYNASTHAAQH